jgi:large subunit ribosomal protein L28
MPKQCQLTGARSRSGQNVSHSNIKTKRRFDPNLQRVRLHSDALGRQVPLRITTRVLRTVQKHGGLDAWLLGTADARLAPEALRLKRAVRKALG